VRKLKVLIGGAESVFCGVRKAALELTGCEVIHAPDGKQACAAVLAANVDLCIFDWDLPKMNGLAACCWIRSVELTAQPHIVLLTEKMHPEQIEAAYRAGANDFIAKPLTLEDLRSLVLRFAHKVSQQEMACRHLTHLDPLELYRRDLNTVKAFPRL
jgi:CheY-like chemotaxis protein